MPAIVGSLAPERTDAGGGDELDVSPRSPYAESANMYSELQSRPLWLWVDDALAAIYQPPQHSRRTLQKMRHALGALASQAEAPAELDESTVAAAIREMASRGAEPTSINSMLRHARIVSRFLVSKGVIKTCPFSLNRWTLPEPRARRRQHSHLSADQVAAILGRADQEHADAVAIMPRFRAGRLRALVWLVVHTGLRAEEALCLTRGDFDGRFVDVRPTNHRDQRLKTAASERLVAVPIAAAQRLDEWSIELDRYQFLFPTMESDSPWINGSEKYRPSGQLKALGNRCGVPGVTLQTLRHTAITHLRTRFGFSDTETQFVAGHSNTQTQSRYTHEDRENLSRMMARVRFL